MTDWTQRIEAAIRQGWKVESAEGMVQHADIKRSEKAVKALMNEYAIERLEELKGEQHYDYEGNPVVSLTLIEAMQRSLKERLAKGGEL